MAKSIHEQVVLSDGFDLAVDASLRDLGVAVAR